jgi:hypothetical protein
MEAGVTRTVAKSICAVGELLSYLERSCGVGSKPKDKSALVSSLQNDQSIKYMLSVQFDGVTLYRARTSLLFDHLG